MAIRALLPPFAFFIAFTLELMSFMFFMAFALLSLLLSLERERVLESLALVEICVLMLSCRS